MHFWYGSYCQNMNSNMFSIASDVKLVRKYHNNEFVPIFISFYSLCAAQYTRIYPYTHSHISTHAYKHHRDGGGRGECKDEE